MPSDLHHDPKTEQCAKREAAEPRGLTYHSFCSGDYFGPLTSGISFKSDSWYIDLTEEVDGTRDQTVLGSETEMLDALRTLLKSPA